MLDVSTAFYDAVLADSLLSIARATLEDAEKTLDYVRLGFKVGRLPEFEVLRAAVRRRNQLPVVARSEAAREQAFLRLRPILMTSFALVAGMMPVALGTGEGADFRAPMGQAIVGGIITSTLLTLLVIPTIYDILSTWRDTFVRWVGSKTGSHARDLQPGESERAA